MSSYNRYFRVTGGPLMAAARSIEQEKREAFDICDALRKELSADSFNTYKDGRFAGFGFKQFPDPSVWKQPDQFGLYWPRKNTVRGKEIMKRIEALPKLRGLEYSLEAVGLAPHVPALIDGNVWYAPTAFGAPALGVMFVRVPWRDEKPEKLAAYKSQRDSDKRTHFCIELDLLTWEPPAEFAEVKEWEVQKEIEELKAKLKNGGSQK